MEIVIKTKTLRTFLEAMADMRALAPIIVQDNGNIIAKGVDPPHISMAIATIPASEYTSLLTNLQGQFTVNIPYMLSYVKTIKAEDVVWEVIDGKVKLVHDVIIGNSEDGGVIIRQTKAFEREDMADIPKVPKFLENEHVRRSMPTNAFLEVIGTIGKIYKYKIPKHSNYAGYDNYIEFTLKENEGVDEFRMTMERINRGEQHAENTFSARLSFPSKSMFCTFGSKSSLIPTTHILTMAKKVPKNTDLDFLLGDDMPMEFIWTNNGVTVEQYIAPRLRYD